MKDKDKLRLKKLDVDKRVHEEHIEALKQSLESTSD